MHGVLLCQTGPSDWETAQLSLGNFVGQFEKLADCLHSTNCLSCDILVLPPPDMTERLNEGWRYHAFQRNWQGHMSEMRIQQEVQFRS